MKRKHTIYIIIGFLILLPGGFLALCGAVVLSLLLIGLLFLLAIFLITFGLVTNDSVYDKLMTDCFQAMGSSGVALLIGGALVALGVFFISKAAKLEVKNEIEKEDQ